MVCPQCLGIEEEFNADVARRELRAYRRRGPSRATRLLIDEIVRRDVHGSTHLDIGGGVGAIQHALLEAGAARAGSVDASAAYLQAAAEEAIRRGLEGRIDQHHGDFVALADQVPAADVVTLDRVICCYPDGKALVTASAAHARRLYGLIYPRRTWWLRPAFFLGNLLLRLRGSSFRIFLHAPEVVEGPLEHFDFTRRFSRRSGIWQVALYESGVAR